MYADSVTNYSSQSTRLNLHAVTMNTQLHSATKTTAYEVVFGIKPSLEPVSALRIVEEPADEMIQT